SFLTQGSAGGAADALLSGGWGVSAESSATGRLSLSSSGDHSPAGGASGTSGTGAPFGNSPAVEAPASSAATAPSSSSDSNSVPFQPPAAHARPQLPQRPPRTFQTAALVAPVLTVPAQTLEEGANSSTAVATFIDSSRRDANTFTAQVAWGD